MFGSLTEPRRSSQRTAAVCGIPGLACAGVAARGGGRTAGVQGGVPPHELGCQARGSEERCRRIRGVSLLASPALQGLGPPRDSPTGPHQLPRTPHAAANRR